MAVGREHWDNFEVLETSSSSSRLESGEAVDRSGRKVMCSAHRDDRQPKHEGAHGVGGQMVDQAMWDLRCLFCQRVLIAGRKNCPPRLICRRSRLSAHASENPRARSRARL